MIIQVMNIFKSKLEKVQYRAGLEITGAIKGTSSLARTHLAEDVGEVN